MIDLWLFLLIFSFQIYLQIQTYIPDNVLPDSPLDKVSGLLHLLAVTYLGDSKTYQKWSLFIRSLYHSGVITETGDCFLCKLILNDCMVN